MVIEMVNYLKSYIKMLIEYKSNDANFIRKTIDNLLIRNEIQEVISIAKEYDYFKNDAFVKALVEKNIKQLVSIQTEIYAKEKFKKNIKRWISNLLK
jgi:prefoldin subunit 5